MTKEEIFEQIRLMLSQLFEIDKEEITLESKLFEELELDSIDAVDLVVKLQKNIGKKIMPEEFKQVRTVQDVVDVVAQILWYLLSLKPQYQNIILSNMLNTKVRLFLKLYL